MKRIREVLDEMGIKHDINENSAKIEFWTDTAMQDISVKFEHDGSVKDLVNKFCEYAENYDVDSEVELFIGMRGQRGDPNTVRELIDDCQEAKDTLMEIADKLKKAINTK